VNAGKDISHRHHDSSKRMTGKRGGENGWREEEIGLREGE
jgi:hypothetical protein